MKTPGSGRKKGTLNKDKQKILDLAKQAGKDPVVFMLETMSDKDQPYSLRIDCAKAAAPYTNKRMPQATEVTGENSGPIVITLNDADEKI